MLYKTLFVINTFYNLNVQQINIVITFLFNFLNETIYIKHSYYFAEDLEIYYLYKVLYNLKQFS